MEIAKMVFTFTGGILTMHLIASLIKRTQTGNICNEDYFVGLVEYTGETTSGPARTKRKVQFIINLYMKELKNGKSKRDFTFIGDHEWKELFFKDTKDGQQIKGWQAGGPFPQSFHPVEPLGEMLNRMMKAKFTGKDITVSVEQPYA